MFHCFGHRTYVSKLKCFTRRTNVCWSQFHQHLHARFSYKFWLQSHNVTTKAAKMDVRTKKTYKKMLMKLSIGVNLINVFCAFFLYECHFGSFFLVACTYKNDVCAKKFVHLTLMKLTVGVNFIQHFIRKFFVQKYSFSLVLFWLYKFLAQIYKHKRLA